MSIKDKLEEILKQLDKTDDYLEISNFGDDIWDIIEGMNEKTDPSVLPLLERAINSEASVYIIDNALSAIGKIGGDVAENILGQVREEYADADSEIFQKSGELLASLNPKKYISEVDEETQYRTIKIIAQTGDLKAIKDAITKTSKGISLVNELKMSLMWIALDVNSVDFCQYLLDEKIDLTLKNAYGETAIVYAGKQDNKASSYLMQKL